MVSIIIVNYRTGEYLRACLESIERAVGIPHEVIVVDNNSPGESFTDLEASTGVKVIRLPENLGFAKACNVGAKAATGQVLHFLNPDCVLSADINDSYATALNRLGKEREIYSTRITDQNGRIVKSSHLLPTFVNLKGLVLREPPDRLSRWHIGASVVVGAEIFRGLGGFSEEFFMYSEDLDLFFKALQQNVRAIELPALVIHHSGGASKKVWSNWERLRRTEASARIFVTKHGLRCSYFVFKHLAFLKTFWCQPTTSTSELCAYWSELIAPFKKKQDRTLAGSCQNSFDEF